MRKPPAPKRTTNEDLKASNKLLHRPKPVKCAACADPETGCKPNWPCDCLCHARPVL